MPSVVRVQGLDADVARVVSAAVQMVPAAHRRKWSQELSSLESRRAQRLREMAERGGERAVVSTPEASHEGSSGRGGLVLWWIVCSLAVVAVVVGAATLLPPGRSGNDDPALALAIAVPAMVTAAALAAVLAVLPVPRGVRRTQTAFGFALLSVVSLAAGAAFALLYRDMWVEAAGAEALLWWGAAAVVAALAWIVVAIRVRRIDTPSQAVPAQPVRPSNADDVKAARRLAGEFPLSKADRERWASVVDQLRPAVAREVDAQARELGPFAYTAWAYYDGERDLPRPHQLLR